MVARLSLRICANSPELPYFSKRVLIEFSLIVKAAPLIFVPGRGSANSSALGPRKRECIS